MQVDPLISHKFISQSKILLCRHREDIRFEADYFVVRLLTRMTLSKLNPDAPYWHQDNLLAQCSIPELEGRQRLPCAYLLWKHEEEYINKNDELCATEEIQESGVHPRCPHCNGEQVGPIAQQA
jgi:hypothetical protein